MYYLVYGFLYLISLLPFSVIYLISDFAYFIIFYIIRYRREVVMNNLDIAFPEKTKMEKIEIAKKFYKNLTDTFIETIKLLSISEKEFFKRVSIDLEEIFPLAQQGKNIQFHCGHQFGWEFGNWIIAKKMPISFIGIYMKIKNKLLDRLFYNLRSKPGTILVAAQEFKQKMHQLFSNQYSIGLVADQNPGEASYAYWLNFFNRPAPFVTGPDRSAIKNNTVVVFVNLKKIKRGHYFFETELYCVNGSQCKEGEITLSYRDFLENSIKQQPDNYLWSHRRWKFEYNHQYSNRWIDVSPPIGSNV